MASSRYVAQRPPDPNDRAAKLAQLVAGSGSRVHHVPFRDGYIDAAVVTVEQEQLVYRADNGRLFSELVARGEAREQRGDAAQQQLLHQLLLDKAMDPDGPIYSELERHAKQTEPLLVAADGVVVNGNRRLASMRELHAIDPERFGDFAHISVAVLPARLTAGDIEYIEAALQLAPELKLDYSWINRRLKLRDHVERLGIDEDAILAAYRFESAAAIERELGELALAERFLRYSGEPGNFDLVGDLEEPFTEMKRQLDTFENRKVVDLWILAGFALIRGRDRLDRPLDHYYPFTKPVPFEFVHWGLRSLAEEKGLVEEQRPGENRPVDRLLSDRLSPYLEDRANADDAAGRLGRLNDRLRAEADHMIGAAQAIAHLTRARKSLLRLGAAELSETQRKEIRAELAAFKAHIDELEGKGEGAQPGVFSRIIGRG
ncbi:hypothetical protein [Parasphingopyxis marina]|uniref:Uncharacterized protein n=1 Tax=Parasphingopyxis marina TaxID=2761622 RepID=A0A842I123_9SPHN|nr:hypothetical protein [Parasphingopyxis marina]MBC2778825.1 hypothetical protein [Parasphingopyxis marina]